MKKVKLFLLMAFTGLIMTSGCSKDDPIDPAKQADPTEFTVTPKTVAAAASGTYSINVTCDAAWTATSSADWCKLVKGDGVITVTVAENTTSEPRTATITVTANATTRTVTVTQAATPNGTVKCTVETRAVTFRAVTFYATAKNITVNWGDGSTAVEYNNLDNTPVTHTYTASNRYTVQIQAVELSLFSSSGNGLIDLDVSNCSTLEMLYCHINQLSTLDVSKNTALTSLSCGANQLSTLDVSKNTALTSLSCENNQLSTLDVSKNTALTSLRCSNNPLNTLDVSNNTALTSLSCGANQLSADALNQIFTDLPDWSRNRGKSIHIYNNPGIDTCDRSIATNKGWYFYQ